MCGCMYLLGLLFVKALVFSVKLEGESLTEKNWGRLLISGE